MLRNTLTEREEREEREEVIIMIEEAVGTRKGCKRDQFCPKEMM